MILVTGATGTVGREVVTQLLAARQEVRALTRNPTTAGLPPEVEVVAGDLDRTETLASAVKGIERVFSLALRVTGSRADAEDAAQEAFARVWRKAPDWQAGEARFSTWLYRVTMNLCIDARRRPRAEQLDLDLPLADPGAGTVEMMIDRERDQQVQAAMAALPERQREAMALCYTLGLSNAAAAETMEISVKAYEALLVRAKREIRARLEGSES